MFRFILSVGAFYLLVSAPSLWSGGAAEAAAIAPRGNYLAERGVILPWDQIHVEDYIASIDYGYPDPDGPVGVTVHTGNRQISAFGQTQLIMMGVQGRRLPLDRLPPLNLCFAVDTSGSMGEPDKLDWARRSLEILGQAARDQDIVSLVGFDAEARVIVPPSPMGAQGARDRFLRAVATLVPEGESDLAAGLQIAYEQVSVHFDPLQTNRVFLLSDGWGRAAGALRLAEEKRAGGIETSAVAYGERADVEFLRRLAKMGGGTSRFISDDEINSEVFGGELPRTAVAAARDVVVRVTLPPRFIVWGTWGYQHRRSGRTMVYSIPTLHSGDYETILIEVRTPSNLKPGKTRLVTVETTYTDLDAQIGSLPPIEAQVEIVAHAEPVFGFSDARVLRAGTMLAFARSLRDIGRTYYGGWANCQTFFEADSLRRHLIDTRRRLGSGLNDEIKLMDHYLRILGPLLNMRSDILDMLIADWGITPTQPDRPLNLQLQHLFHEVYLSLESVAPGNVAVYGFSLPSDRSSPITDYLNDAAAVHLSRLAGSRHRLLERKRLDQVLAEQELALSDLAAPEQAVRIGRFLSADYVLTGTVVEMRDAVVVFARVVNAETAAIESAVQVILPRSSEVESLL